MRADRWPIWKVLLIAVPIFGVLAALVGYLPTYSPGALALATSMALAAVLILTIAFAAGPKSWYLGALYLGIWCGLFIAMGARHWAALLPKPWVSYLVHVILYMLMWALPAIAPKLSAFIEREGRYPETRLGLGCFRVSLLLLPVGGSTGALIAMYGLRYGQVNWVNLFIAVAGTAGGLGLMQYFAHHLWQERPWAEEPDSARQVEAS